MAPPAAAEAPQAAAAAPAATLNGLSKDVMIYIACYLKDKEILSFSSIKR